MALLSCFSKSPLARLTVLALGIIIVQSQAVAQTQPQRSWLAGRYDRNRIIVYFEAVKFNGTLPNSAKRLVPTATHFFDSVEVSANYIAQVLRAPTAEHFDLGDQYDLILEENHIATVSLTTLVGCETDEGVGNDSFVGALATLSDKDLPYFKRDYYVLRQHQKGRESARPNRSKEIPTVWIRLEDEPVQFKIQCQIVDLLNERMRTLATNAQRNRAERTSPLIEVKAFRLADGAVRYYARAEWKAERDLDRSSFAVGAWISPSPTLHILALEKRTSGYKPFEGVLPNLLNVVNLDGKTGVIVSTRRDDSIELTLMEYRDGVDRGHMPILQSIGAGE